MSYSTKQQDPKHVIALITFSLTIITTIIILVFKAFKKRKSSITDDKVSVGDNTYQIAKINEIEFKNDENESVINYEVVLTHPTTGKVLRRMFPYFTEIGSGISKKEIKIGSNLVI